MTYNDPVIWAEFAIDIAREARAPRRALGAGHRRLRHRRGAPRALRRTSTPPTSTSKRSPRTSITRSPFSHLDPVLETLKWIKRDTNVWLEITNLHDPRPQRRRERDAQARRVGRRRARRRGAAALHRLPPRLQDARHSAHAAVDADAGARRSRARSASSTSTPATSTIAPAAPRSARRARRRSSSATGTPSIPSASHRRRRRRIVPRVRRAHRRPFPLAGARQRRAAARPRPRLLSASRSEAARSRTASGSFRSA